MWLHLALLSYLPWCRTMDSFQFSTPLFPTLPGILISNRNVCEYAWEQIFGRHGDAFRILKSSHCSQWRTVWDIHDHYWDCSELAIIPLHNISWWALRCFHFHLPVAPFHGWNRYKSCWMDSKIQQANIETEVLVDTSYMLKHIF